jgi:hypothetical protein
LRLTLVMVVTVLALGCKDSTKPLDPWVGTWHLMTLDSVAVPDTLEIGGFFARVVQKTLDVYAGGQGIWTDSSGWAGAGCDRGYYATRTTLCNTSGTMVFTWKAVADTLTTTRVFGSSFGYIRPLMNFVKQKDGSLLMDDGIQSEVYRR